MNEKDDFLTKIIKIKAKKLYANVSSEETGETANFSMNKKLFLRIKKCSKVIETTTLITSTKERLQCPT